MITDPLPPVIDPPPLPTPEEIEAIIEEARRRQRRRRRRNAWALAALAAIGLAAAFATGRGGANSETLRPQHHGPAPLAAQTAPPPVMRNGPISMFTFPGVVRHLGSHGAGGRVVARCAGECFGVGDAEWSVDGTKLAYFGTCGGACSHPGPGLGVHIRDLRTGADRLLLHTIPWGTSVGFSSDGSRLAVGSDGRLLVYPLERAASGPRVVRLPRDPGGALEISSPSWSPDGTRIVIGTTSRLGPTAVVVTDGLGFRTLARGTYPDWSPDGRRIAYLVGGQVRTIAPDGTGMRTIAHLGRYLPHWGHRQTICCDGEDLTWSPDGRRLAVMLDETVFVVTPDTGHVHRITARRFSHPPGMEMPVYGVAWQPVAR